MQKILNNLKKKGGRFEQHSILFFSKYIIFNNSFNYNNLTEVKK